MSTQADFSTGPSGQGSGSGQRTGMRPLFWSVQRELWEHRAIYVAPLAVAAVILFGFALSAWHLRGNPPFSVTIENGNQVHQKVIQPYHFAAALIMGTTFIVSILYCLDALYGERRDRSILFWKSLPVSDWTTVLSKAAIPLVILPLLTFGITVVTFCFMVMESSVALLGSGVSVAALWGPVSLLRMSGMLLYHLVTMHALWYAPVYAWLLLVSGWARRAPFLWAVLPPAAICILEKLAFNTAYFAHLLGSRIGGQMESMGSTGFPMDAGAHLMPWRFLSAPGLWGGLAVAALFLAAAVRLRRYRGAI